MHHNKINCIFWRWGRNWDKNMVHIPFSHFEICSKPLLVAVSNSSERTQYRAHCWVSHFIAQIGGLQALRDVSEVSLSKLSAQAVLSKSSSWVRFSCWTRSSSLPSLSACVGVPAGAFYSAEFHRFFFNGGKSAQKYPWLPRNVWSGFSGTGNPNMKLVLV